MQKACTRGEARRPADPALEMREASEPNSGCGSPLAGPGCRGLRHAGCAVRKFGVRRLDLFGSAATGLFDPDRSDLDFVVEFEGAPRPGYFRDFMGFRNALVELFGREVDLLTEKSILNPYLRRQIQAERRQLFPRT